MTRHDPRITRLPKWAQQHITRVERERDAAETELREVIGTAPEETDTIVQRGYQEDPIRLPAGSRVLFGHGGRSGGIEARWQDGHLYVHGGGPLAIRPHVTNVVTITTEAR